MFYPISVYLTLDSYSVHEYINYYNGQVGMVAWLNNNTLYRVGNIKGNRGELAQIICRGLGLETGTVIIGPWVTIDDDQFSFIDSSCVGNESELIECATVAEYDNVTEMVVDYIVCYDDKDETGML